MEKVAWKHIPYQLKERTSRGLLCDSGNSNPMLCDNLEGVGWAGRWEGGSGRRARGTLVADHIDYGRDQHKTVVILQLKRKKFF